MAKCLVIQASHYYFMHLALCCCLVNNVVMGQEATEDGPSRNTWCTNGLDGPCLNPDHLSLLWQLDTLPAPTCEVLLRVSETLAQHKQEEQCVVWCELQHIPPETTKLLSSSGTYCFVSKSRIHFYEGITIKIFIYFDIYYIVNVQTAALMDK